MIWYRHWLELRGRLMLAGIPVLVLAVSYALIIHRVADEYARTGKVGQQEIHLPATLGPDAAVGWALHAALGALVLLFAPLLTAGSGIRTQDGWGGIHPSTSYTLALPTSRWRLVWTRFLAGLGALAAILALCLTANCCGLLLLGRPVPVGLMALSSLNTGLAALPVLSLLGLIALAAGEIWMSMFPIALVILTISWDRVAVTAAHFLLSPTIRWSAAPWTLGLTGLFLGLAIWLAKEMEF